MREGRPLPRKIANAPELDLGLSVYYYAFAELSTDRPLGWNGEGRIPWSSIRAWADDYGFVGDQRDDLFHHIREMDEAYLEYRAKKAPKGKT